ncbi:MAG: hypothetical protein HY819_08845 [Acidobacteria bacterium]|nr:hypothetical protein [Acidobacteriota bacterium]
MSYPCLKCGQPAKDINTLCKRCSSEKTMQKTLIAAVTIAVLALGTIVILLFQTTSSPSNVSTQSSPVPNSINSTNSTNSTSSTGATTNPTPNLTITKIKPDVLENYVNTVQPISSDVRAEMSATILDLKDFLKMVNSTKDPKAIRQIIDNFREQMKKHSDRFVALNRSLRAIAPPAQLEKQHENLSAGIVKYNGSVQGYINGLAAYNFQQIRASQTQLEQADKEILTAMVELQDAFENSKAK